MQGFNMGRYVPPDQEGLTTGNKLAGKHPLGSRARHLHTTGALIVRFEMPFAVWCTTCKPHETLIGQGVRFNAEKKKIGNYYSTPIYSFRIKHTVCGGWIEIQTDPKNTAYVVVEGGRKRDTGEDKPLQPGEIAIRLGGNNEPAISQDPFTRIEGKVEDKRRMDTERDRILELQRRQDRDWDDPYEQSRRLRRTFRAERKVLEREEGKKEALKDKMSLGIELVEEVDEDALRASLVDFESSVGGDTRGSRIRPMFEPRTASSPAATSSSTATTSRNSSGGDKKGKGTKRRKPADLLAERKAQFRSELTGNTRAVVDPFLNHNGTAWQPEIKKRKTLSKVAEANKVPSGSLLTGEVTSENPGTPTVSTPLVDYGSDSD